MLEWDVLPNIRTPLPSPSPVRGTDLRKILHCGKGESCSSQGWIISEPNYRSVSLSFPLKLQSWLDAHEVSGPLWWAAAKQSQCLGHLNCLLFRTKSRKTLPSLLLLRNLPSVIGTGWIPHHSLSQPVLNPFNCYWVGRNNSGWTLVLSKKIWVLKIRAPLLSDTWEVLMYFLNKDSLHYFL